MDNESQQNIPPVQPITQTPITPPPTNWLRIIIFIIFGLIIVAGAVFIGINIGKKQSTNSSVITDIPIDIPSPSLFNTPTSIPISTISVTNSYVTETVILKYRSAFVGEIPKYIYTFTFKKQLKDTINKLKYEDPGLVKISGDATDYGFIINHENIKLEIEIPYEGFGYPIIKKLNPFIINNSKLAISPIFRLKNKDVYGDENKNNLDGSNYTTQYTEDREVCDAFNTIDGLSYPACIASGFDVKTQAGHYISIHCSAEDNGVEWCDEIVKSLNLSINNY